MVSAQGAFRGRLPAVGRRHRARRRGFLGAPAPRPPLLERARRLDAQGPGSRQDGGELAGLGARGLAPR
jgi:hypothetical protein